MDRVVMPKRIGSFKFKGEELHVYKSMYILGDGLGIFILDDMGHPFLTVSENHQLKLQPGHFVAQTRNMSPELRLVLLTCGLFEDTRRTHQFGTFNVTEPIWRLTPQEGKN
jgi:hypothetical protein